MKVVSVRRLACAAAMALAVGHAEASLIWDGDASRGLGVFGNLNCGSPGSVTAVSDASQGTVWRYYKPSGSNRCENHGISVNGSRYEFTSSNDNTTYYFGWRNRLTSLSDNNANFQWKSYGSHIQNYPLLMKMVGGRQTFQYRAPGESCCRVLWSTSISANTWNHQVIAIYLSSSASTGWVELWWNGVQQTLSGGVTRYFARTLDDINEPKWGVYGADSVTMNNHVDGLRLGTTYADVAGGGGGSPTPTPTPTPTPGTGPTPTPCTSCGLSGYYRIMARHSGKAVVVQSASTANSANVFQWTYGGATRNDEWEVRSIGSGYYRVINRHSGKDMVVQSASTAEGANIFQYAYGGTTTNDEWAIVDVGGGYFRITNRHSGKSAEVAGGGTADGANVDQRTYGGLTHQQFQLVSVP